MAPKVPLSMIFHYHKPLLLLFPLGYLGKCIDDIERVRLTRFRDQSALFGGQVKPGDPPSWPE